jgi:hypothetical protein
MSGWGSAFALRASARQPSAIPVLACLAEARLIHERRLAGRQGFFAATLRNPDKDRLFSHKPQHTSILASSSSLVEWRLFASVFVSCQHDDTRDDIRTERSLSFRCRKPTRSNSGRRVSANTTALGVRLQPDFPRSAGGGIDGTSARLDMRAYLV